MRRREGESTLGLWLPLAMAELVRQVVGLFGSPPKVSELLASWMLPHLAKCVKHEEEAAQAEALGRQVEIIERRFGKRETTDGEGITTDP